jgi:putative Holliday junction resolvase
VGEGDARVKVLALDFGAARTGVAVSDPTGTIARPLGIVERAGERGLDQLLALIRDEDPARVVVGMPLTLRGDHGEQAQATAVFVDALRDRVNVPVETYDERFTTTLAERGGGSDAEAAAHLLSSYLEWSSARR